MNKAYIILAHKHADLVKRLIDRLDDHTSDFYLHIDLNSNIQDFQQSLKSNKRVYFLKSEETSWGSFGLVSATLNAMRTLKNVGYGMVILLSGQDYPIKSNQEIDRFFQISPYKIFMNYFPLPNHDKWGPGGGMYRVNKYFFGLSFARKMLAKTMNFMGIILPFAKRKELRRMQPFSGSQWWAMDMEAVNYILNYVDTHPEYIRYHQRTFAPDELFFQMILLNCPDPAITSRIANNNLRFMKWQSGSVAHPEVLGVDDVDDIKVSGCLFARKIDPEIDDKVIDIIDQRVLNY